jgi:hypothetical protein
MRPKLQKQSALKLAGRIIPRAKLSGVRTLDFSIIQDIFFVIKLDISNEKSKESLTLLFFKKALT